MFGLFIHRGQTLHSSLSLKLNHREIQWNTLLVIREAKGFSVTRDGTQIISVMRDRAQIISVMRDRAQISRVRRDWT